MSHKMVFTVQSVLFFLAGLATLIAPQQLIASYGLSLQQGGVGLARLYGVTAIMLGLITWIARESGPSQARKAIVLGLFIGNILAALVGIYNGLAGGFGTVIWVSVIIWLLLALDLGVLYFKKSEDD
ncbi:MAG: hypothetical protein GWP61_12200 [Chloroflexi bacterium]|nr:hypothetical protein [Chloroflexota bacterium]